MRRTVRVETRLVQLPEGAPRAAQVRRVGAAAPQAGHVGAPVAARRARHVRTRPHGLLEAGDLGAHQVDAGAPHEAVLVRPHLERVALGGGRDAQVRVGLVGAARFRFPFGLLVGFGAGGGSVRVQGFGDLAAFELSIIRIV